MGHLFEPLGMQRMSIFIIAQYLQERRVNIKFRHPNWEFDAPSGTVALLGNFREWAHLRLYSIFGV